MKGGGGFMTRIQGIGNTCLDSVEEKLVAVWGLGMSGLRPEVVVWRGAFIRSREAKLLDKFVQNKLLR